MHKLDVITFCQQKITTSCDLSTQRGRDSALLWKFLVLLCQQNGVRVSWEGDDPRDLRSEISYMLLMCLSIQLLFSGECTLKATHSHSTINQVDSAWIFGENPSQGLLFILVNWQQPDAITAWKGNVATFIREPALMLKMGLFH